MYFLLILVPQDEDFSGDKEDSVMTLKTVTVTHSDEPEIKSKLVPTDATETWFEQVIENKGLKRTLDERPV